MKFSTYLKVTTPLIVLSVLVVSKAGNPIPQEFFAKAGLTVLEESEAHALFNSIKDKKKFRYRWNSRIDNGACAIRAEALDDYLKEQKNIRSARVWIRCDKHKNNTITAVDQSHNIRYNYGNYHVANVLQVKDAATGELKNLVFDPQFQPAPKELEAYLDEVVKNRVNYKNLSLEDATKLHGTKPCQVNLTTYSRDSYVSSTSEKFL